MKKVALSLAGVMAVAAFAPEASALPLFARQTGMACNACHFQHFPMLNGFGRSFKASGFTLMGAQGKVEGENLSIPDTLNLAVLTTAGYVKTNGTTKATAASGLKTANDGQWYVPGSKGEFSLFIGGRTSDNSGALAEVGLTQTGGTGAGLASAKLPMLWEVADGTRVGVVPFTTDAQGASYGFEELNTGANAVHTMLFAGGDFNGSITGTLSAQQYIGTGGTATGLAFVANNSMGFVNVTKYSGFTANNAAASTGALTSTYLRVAGTFDLAGWDAGAGIQSWSGSSAAPSAAATTASAIYATKATAIDGQMQGEIAGMPVGFYASYARAPVAGTSGVVGAGTNAYNQGGVSTKSSFNISTEWGVIPEKATLGAAIRRAKNGAGAGVDGDNAYLLSGSYKLAQNMMLQLVYTKQSGSAWATPGATGDTQTAFNLATIF